MFPGQVSCQLEIWGGGAREGKAQISIRIVQLGSQNWLRLRLLVLKKKKKVISLLKVLAICSLKYGLEFQVGKDEKGGVPATVSRMWLFHLFEKSPQICVGFKFTESYSMKILNRDYDPSSIFSHPVHLYPSFNPI